MAGYNITCDPGDLYTRKCYVNTASGKQEIIGYDSAGNPISKAPTTSQQDSLLKVRSKQNIGIGSFKPRKSLGKQTHTF